MLNPLYLVWAGAALNLAAGLYYTYSTVRGPSSTDDTQLKPNPVAWGIWSLSGWLAFFGQVTEGVRDEALLTLCVAATPTLIFIAALVSRRRYGVYAPISRLDITCGGLALVTLAAWRVTDSGSVAIALSIVCDALVAIPVVRQAYRDPTSDNPSIWLAGAINAVITLSTFRSFTFLTAGFGLYFLALCLLVSYLLVVRPRLHRHRHGPLPGSDDALSGSSFTDTVADRDNAAAAFAGSFAADYLTWDEQSPQRRADALTSYIDGTADALWGWSGSGRQRADLVLIRSASLAQEGYYVVDLRVRVTPGVSHSGVSTNGPAPVIIAAATAKTSYCETNTTEPIEIPLPGIAANSLASPADAALENRWFRLQIPVVDRRGRFCIPT